MRLILTTIAALAVAAPAFAGGYEKTQSHAPAQMLVHKYPAKHNFCPAGLQPITMNGVICCGTPNAGPYVDRAGGKRKVHTHRKTVTHTHAKTHSHTTTHTHSHSNW